MLRVGFGVYGDVWGACCGLGMFRFAASVMFRMDLVSLRSKMFAMNLGWRVLGFRVKEFGGLGSRDV